MLKKISVGTIMLPPAMPASPESRPAPRARAVVPAASGCRRCAGGCQRVRRITAIAARNAPRKRVRTISGSRLASVPAPRPPSMSPGVQRQSRGHSRAPRRHWARPAARLVKIMAPRPVATASRMPRGRAKASKIRTREGTMITPPPIPSSPPRKPVPSPRAKQRGRKLPRGITSAMRPRSVPMIKERKHTTGENRMGLYEALLRAAEQRPEQRPSPARAWAPRA